MRVARRERTNIECKICCKVQAEEEIGMKFKESSLGLSAGSPLLLENHERASKEIPRDPEVIELFKKLAGAESLPPR